jgi:hypothetical protein
MKKTILFVSSLVLTISMTTGFVLSRFTRNMQSRMNTKDLPEHGLVIIKSSDPDFDSMTAVWLQGVTSDEIETLKPLSFFIKNTGSRTVVAHAIVSECIQADGQRKSYRMTHANSEALTDPEEYFSALSRTNLDKTIKPGAARLFSLIPLPSTFMNAGGAGSGLLNTQTEQGVTRETKAETLQSSLQSLAGCTDITVSIDGVFFDDGTFVGPDTTGFFENMKAQVEAKLALRRDIAKKLKTGKSKDEIFKDIEDKANPKPSAPNLAKESNPAAYHDFFSRFFAMQILRYRKLYGEDHALDKAQGPKNRPEPVLRKLK